MEAAFFIIPPLRAAGAFRADFLPFAPPRALPRREPPAPADLAEDFLMDEDLEDFPAADFPLRLPPDAREDLLPLLDVAMQPPERCAPFLPDRR
jgi:hypothetical protein